MKKRILAGLTAACVTLSGCAGMLEREFVFATPHNSTKTEAGSSSVLRAESYQELVNSLIYFISTGSEEGVIRLYMQAEEVDEALRSARLEVLLEYPLAAYAVENISFELSPLVAFSEAKVSFLYRRTQQQVSSIISATGISAVRSELTAALTGFASERVLRISYFDRDTDYVRSLIRQSYYDTPLSALEYPELEINIYPDTGIQRIVEVFFHYDTDTSVLSQRAVLLEQTCRRLADGLPETQDIGQTVTAAIEAILGAGGYDPDGGSSAYHALLEGGANSEGLALAMAALCQEYLDIPCRVASGMRNGVPCCWNVVSTDSGWRHVDLSDCDPANPFANDEQFHALGYMWDSAALPSCT